VFRGPGELVGLWVPGRYLALFFNPMTLSVGIRLLCRVAFMIHDVIVTNNVYWTLGDKGWIKPTCTYKRLYTYTQETENVSDNCVRSRTVACGYSECNCCAVGDGPSTAAAAGVPTPESGTPLPERGEIAWVVGG